MPAAAWKPGLYVGRDFRIVEHQQPPVPAVHVSQQVQSHSLSARSGLDAAQRQAEGGELFPDQPGLLSIDPPRHAVTVSEQVRILNRQLGLAHPGHALESLHHRPVVQLQLLAHRRQQPTRPVKPGLRAGMFHTRSTLPGGSGPASRRLAASSRKERSTNLPSSAGFRNDWTVSPLSRTRRRNSSCRSPNWRSISSSTGIPTSAAAVSSKNISRGNPAAVAVSKSSSVYETSGRSRTGEPYRVPSTPHTPRTRARGRYTPASAADQWREGRPYPRSHAPHQKSPALPRPHTNSAAPGICAARKCAK